MSLETASNNALAAIDQQQKQVSLCWQETNNQNSAVLLPKSPLAALRQTGVAKQKTTSSNFSTSQLQASNQSNPTLWYSKHDQTISLCQSGQNKFHVDSIKQNLQHQICLHTPETAIQTNANGRSSTTPPHNTSAHNSLHHHHQPREGRVSQCQQSSTPDSFQWTSSVTPESKDYQVASRKLFEVPENSTAVQKQHQRYSEIQKEEKEEGKGRAREQERVDQLQFAENKLQVQLDESKDLQESTLKNASHILTKSQTEKAANNQLSNSADLQQSGVSNQLLHSNSTPSVKPFSINQGKILAESRTSSYQEGGLHNTADMECQKEVREFNDFAEEEVRFEQSPSTTLLVNQDQTGAKNEKNSLKQEGEDKENDLVLKSDVKDQSTPILVESKLDALKQVNLDLCTAQNLGKLEEKQASANANKISEVSNLDNKFEDQSLNLAVKFEQTPITALLNCSDIKRFPLELYPKKSASESIPAPQTSQKRVGAVDSYQKLPRNNFLTPETQIRTYERQNNNFDSQDSSSSEKDGLINQGAKIGHLLPNQSTLNQQSQMLIQILGEKREDHQGFLALLNLINPLAWSKSQQKPHSSLATHVHKKSISPPNPYKQILRTLEMQDRALQLEDQGDELENALNAGSLENSDQKQFHLSNSHTSNSNNSHDNKGADSFYQQQFNCSAGSKLQMQQYDLQRQRQLQTIEQDNELIAKATQFLKSDALFKVMPKNATSALFALKAREKNSFEAVKADGDQRASKSIFQKPQNNSLFTQLSDLSISSIKLQEQKVKGQLQVVKNEDLESKIGENQEGNRTEKSKCEEVGEGGRVKDRDVSVKEDESSSCDLAAQKAEDLPNFDKNGGINQAVACSEDLVDQKSSSFSVYTAPKVESKLESASDLKPLTYPKLPAASNGAPFEAEVGQTDIASKDTKKLLLEKDLLVDFDEQTKEIQALIGNPPVFDKRVNYLSAHRAQQAVLKSTQRSYKIEFDALKSILHDVTSLERYNRHLKSCIAQKREEKLALKENFKIRQATTLGPSEKITDCNLGENPSNRALDIAENPLRSRDLFGQEVRTDLMADRYPKTSRFASFNAPDAVQENFGAKIGFKRLASVQQFEEAKNQMTENASPIHAKFPSKSQSNLLYSFKDSNLSSNQKPPAMVPVQEHAKTPESRPKNDQKVTTLAQIVSQFKKNQLFTPPSSSNYAVNPTTNSVETPPQPLLFNRASNPQHYPQNQLPLLGSVNGGISGVGIKNQTTASRIQSMTAALQQERTGGGRAGCLARSSSTFVVGNHQLPYQNAQIQYASPMQVQQQMQQSQNRRESLTGLSYYTGNNSVLSGSQNCYANVKNQGNSIRRPESKQPTQYRTKQAKSRRSADMIQKEYKCMHCEGKWYGTEAACIMHMRKKHREGTKGEIEKREGMTIGQLCLRPRPPVASGKTGNPKQPTQNISQTSLPTQGGEHQPAENQ